tara:strand:+ start:58315 stop:59439 length:1125 start_codon:yes stop_codon:yes gene_type:complete
MKNILITGGAGFIGTNLTYRLVDLGYNITILDNLSKQIHNQDSPLIKKIKEVSNFIEGDVRKKSDWSKAIKGQDAIIHLAAETGTGQSMYDIARYNEVNIMGTANLLDILTNKKHNVNKIIIASSRSIYGEGKYYCKNHGIIYPGMRDEKNMSDGRFDIFCEICNNIVEMRATDESSRISPNSIYAITKQQQEQITLLIGKVLKIPTVALRFQNVYGPNQSLSNPYTGILSIFSTSILNGNNIEVYEDGKETRDFIYIDDAVDAIILSLKKEEANYHIFNVGSGVATPVLDIANILKRLYDSNIEVKVNGKYRLGDIRNNFADLTRINKLLGFRPNVNLDKGISMFVSWVKSQKIQFDKYQSSIEELENKGLIR